MIAYLGQRDIRNDNRVQCTRSVLHWPIHVVIRVILVLALRRGVFSIFPGLAVRNGGHGGIVGSGRGLDCNDVSRSSDNQGMRRSVDSLKRVMSGCRGGCEESIPSRQPAHANTAIVRKYRGCWIH
jgi:hypothetical protein